MKTNKVLIIEVVVVIMMLGLVLYSVTQPTSLDRYEELMKSIGNSEPVINQVNPVNEDETALLIKDNDLMVTFNYGQDWKHVPVALESIQNGEYIGDDEIGLIQDSYVLDADTMSLVYVDRESDDLSLVHTADEGQTWENTVIDRAFPGIRYRKLDFVTHEFGYVIVSGGRTMGQEGVVLYTTTNQGETWEQGGPIKLSTLLQTSGFVDDRIGFLSFKSILKEKEGGIRLSVTRDGGQTWEESQFHIPDDYEAIFTTAELPYLEGDNLVVLVNQGETGDYLGGQVKGKFNSIDNGLTWEFVSEVEEERHD